MKKLLSIILALVMVLSMAACSSEAPSENNNTNANTVEYWNSKDGYVGGDAAEENAVEDVPEEVVPGTYTYECELMGSPDLARIILSDDGVANFCMPKNAMITDVYEGTYTREGDVVTITGFANVDASSPYPVPGLWSWIDAATGDAVIIVDDAAGTFAPAE